MPIGIKLERRPGWRKPAGAVLVSRPGPFGNPFISAHLQQFLHLSPVQLAVEGHRWWLMLDHSGQAIARRAESELRGRDLCCWCDVGAPCHRDNLLDAAAGRLWDGWSLESVDGEQFLIQTKKADGRWHATVFPEPMPIGSLRLKTDRLWSPSPRVLGIGKTVLGDWPTQELAIDAGREMIKMAGGPTLADMDRAKVK
jgi:hypothetical protein